MNHTLLIPSHAHQLVPGRISRLQCAPCNTRFPVASRSRDLAYAKSRYKVAVVTGASKGIGNGITTALGAEGARVAVNYSSDREGAERVAQAITDNGGEAIAVGVDVSKAADVARLFKEVDSAFGRLDVLVNNAGVFRFGPIRHQFQIASWSSSESGRRDCWHQG